MCTRSNWLLSKALFAFCIIAGILITGCEPKAGDPGPEGDTGAQGPRGETGAQGPKGDVGTANVIYSPWTNVTFSGSGSLYTGNLTTPRITQEVLDKADIRVYWSEGGRILTLPYAETLGGATCTVHQRIYVGRVEFRASYAICTQQFRYVIIPGGTPTGRLASVDLTDYAAVKEAFNILD
jgi:hypothetical protein